LKNIMEQKTLDLLEFKKVQQMLANEASTPLGRAVAMKVFPRSAAIARQEQELGREVMRALTSLTSPNLQGAVDVRRQVRRAEQGVTLSPKDLVDLLNVLRALNSLKRWLEELDLTYPKLMKVKSCIADFSELSMRLSQIVDGEGEIKDSASPALSSIRRSIREFEDRIRKRAEEIVRRRDLSDILQEPIITIRNQRFVIPVKQEHASKVQGLVHDQSASGQTLFIEPVEILEMSNDLRRLELRERDEVERILIEISNRVGEYAPTLLEALEALAEFDLGLAKARLAHRWNGSFPIISDKHVLHLESAWHPLLKGNPVPMSISLEEDGIRTLVITGPNMGGKTVALKTCGLLTVMALAGMPCPVKDGTIVGDISDVLCDIGDEQSIEENLSTFSAHISNVIRILKQSRPGTLVLIDELGAGTDPGEGAALALAVLKRINESKAISVITSHYGELKIMAQKSSGMQNASVEWDAVQLKPTYRLVVGVPGRSNAFLVAARLGLQPEILEEARKNMDEEVVRLDDILRQLEESSQQARIEAETANRERVRVQALRQELENKVKSLEQSRSKVLKDARAEAESMVQRARVELEKLVREIRQEAKKGQAIKGNTVAAMRDRLSEMREELSPENEVGFKENVGSSLSIQDIEVGHEVLVEGLSERGIVVESPDESGLVMVRVGSFTMRVDVSRLREAETVKKERRSLRNLEDKQKISMEKARSISSELDLRGMTKEEVYATLDKYLDDVLLASLGQIRIIHGKGTGVLRKAVSDYLADHPAIAEHRLGTIAEGGDGVTVAKIRNK
jgi:DNA mismatch repair protein MutS2